MNSNKLFSRLLSFQNIPSRIIFGNAVKLETGNQRIFCSQVGQNSVSVEFHSGLPHFKIPLPSRRENCLFVLSPISQNVGDLINSIKEEDHGVDRVAFYDKDGMRLSKSNSIYTLLTTNFNLNINDVTYPVDKPLDCDSELQENVQRLADVKNLITQLSITLRSDEHNLNQEKELKEKEQQLQAKIKPLEEKRYQIALKAAKRTRTLTWIGLGAMGLQFGLLARLTWWEYSWDIMEPVTYFVGYGTAIAMYAYYVVTRQEYCFPQVFDREYLKRFYTLSDKGNFDVTHYNELCDQLAQIRSDLVRLRDPLLLNLPLQQKHYKVDDKDDDNDNIIPRHHH